MPTRALRAGIRGLTGVAALAVAGAVIAAAVALPLPGHSAAAPAVTVTPAAAAPLLVCPGPLLALAADSTKANVASAFGTPSIADGSSTGIDPVAAGLPGPKGSDGAAESLTLPATKPGADPAQLAAAQSQSAGLDDFVGFAAASCVEPSGDTWLVGGSSTLGETTLILLANPTAVAATVTLTVYGAKGVVDTPGGGLSVQPGTQQIVALAGIAPGQAAPVIHVESKGGRVVASLQQSLTRGLEPGGVALAGATAAPAKHQVIPGTVVSTLAALKKANASESYPEALPAVRVLVPGDEAATVTVGAVNENGQAAGASAAVQLPAGIPTEIPLPGLSDGTYTLTVDASAPIVAAARTSTTSKSGKDFSWFAAAEPLSQDFLLPVASGPSAKVHVSNPTSADATVTFTPLSGSGAKKLTVPAGATGALPLRAGAVYRVTGAHSVLVSVSYSRDGALASYALQPSSPLDAPLTVYPRP